MKTSTTTRRLAFTIGLLAASVGCSGKVVQPKAGDVIENSIRLKLAYIEPGEFEMGSPESEKGRSGNEVMHQVKITKGFYLGVYEVTQSQFKKVLGQNPAWFSKNGGGKPYVASKDTAAFPVEQISWYDAVEFCNALSNREGLPEYYTLQNIKRNSDLIENAEVVENGGLGYRLPTEAEWEYACRAGTKTPFHFGDELNGDNANIYAKPTKGPYLKRTQEVGSFKPNKFGLYDMHGNVFEWCNDRYEDYLGDSVDPKGPVSGKARVVRGGSYRDNAKGTRSAFRTKDRPMARGFNLGFRVARTYP